MRERLREKTLERLSLLFFALAPIFWGGGFFVAGLQEYSISNIQGLTIYPTYALPVILFVLGFLYLYRKENSGTASVLFVLMFYEILFFALTLLGISAIVITQALIPPLGELEIVTQFARAFVSLGRGGTWVAVTAFYVALFSGNLTKRIPLFPWSAKRSRGKHAPK